MKYVMTLLLCAAWSVIAAGREVMYVKANVALPMLEFTYGDLDAATTNKLADALRGVPPFSHWKPVAGTNQVNRLEVTFRGEPMVEVSCRLYSEAGSTIDWLSKPIPVDNFRGTKADDVAGKLVEAGIALVRERAVEMHEAEQGLSNIPIATAPAEWKNRAVGELILPLDKEDHPTLLKANPFPRFRIRTAWQKEPSNPAVVDVYANANGQSAGYPAKKRVFDGVVVVMVSVLYPNEPSQLDRWKKEFKKFSFRNLYLAPPESSGVKRPKS